MVIRDLLSQSLLLNQSLVGPPINPEHISILKKGTKIWNRWRSENAVVQPRLQGANLKGVELRKANLFGAYLREVNLAHADLREADLRRSDLFLANLDSADLRNAHLSHSSLRGASLDNADLTTAFLVRADLSYVPFQRKRTRLRKAILTNANLREANLYAADLSKAKLTGASLEGASLHHASLVDADLRGANLSKATLIETNLTRAKLNGCYVHGISAWDLELTDADQSNLNIGPYEEAKIIVDYLEVAQFVYLLLNNEKIRDVIDSMTSKAVLILGRFTPVRKAILEAIQDELRKHGYLPILFDFEKSRSRDTQETIVTLAGLVRFIVADITDPKSIPQELGGIVEKFPSLPVQPLLQTGHKPWGMYDHIRQYPWVLPLVPYRNLRNLLALMKPKVIASAEEWLARRREQPPSTRPGSRLKQKRFGQETKKMFTRKAR